MMSLVLNNWAQLYKSVLDCYGHMTKLSSYDETFYVIHGGWLRQCQVSIQLSDSEAHGPLF